MLTRHRKAWAWSVCLGLLTIAACAHRAAVERDAWRAAVASELRDKVAKLVTATRTVDGEPVLASRAVATFYRKRKFEPAWFENGVPSHQVPALLETARDAGWDGLSPEEYHVPAIERLLDGFPMLGDRAQTAKRAAELEILLSDAFCTLGAHLFAGRLNPNALNEDWAIKRRGLRMSDTLEKALASASVASALEKLRPDDKAYAELRRLYRAYATLAEKGDHPPVPEGRKIKPGDRGPRVARLWARLVPPGETPPARANVYDGNLLRAVAAFQRAHGLKVDGIADKATISELNVPARERVRQLRVNLERARWLPRDLGDRYLWVDIANFNLSVVEKHHPVMQMKVVVGKEQKETPVFSEAMTYIVLNPRWLVPRSISVEEILPKVQRDPGYLAKKGIKVYRPDHGKRREIAADSVDWSALTEENFNLLLEEPPGPANPLGSIKFMFPNNFAVYLHGTPNRALFTKDRRNLSHGCVRVERPAALAAYLLKDADPPWSEEDLGAAIREGKEHVIPLPEPIEVHTFYRTAWVDEHDVLQIRRDIYGWDQPVWVALYREQPRVPAAE